MRDAFSLFHQDFWRALSNMYIIMLTNIHTYICNSSTLPSVPWLVHVCTWVLHIYVLYTLRSLVTHFNSSAPYNSHIYHRDISGRCPHHMHIPVSNNTSNFSSINNPPLINTSSMSCTSIIPRRPQLPLPPNPYLPLPNLPSAILWTLPSSIPGYRHILTLLRLLTLAFLTTQLLATPPIRKWPILIKSSTMIM